MRALPLGLSRAPDVLLRRPYHRGGRLMCLCRDITAGVQSCGNVMDGWTCTREKGHEGAHVACGGDIHRMMEWDDE